MRLRGRVPQLSGAAVPAVLADLWRDLRDRRLLPLVALIAVAIVAVPILLGGGGGSDAPPPAAPADGGASGAGARSDLAVVTAAPGLRDYRKRLRGAPSDPFRQRYTGVPATARLQPAGGSEAAPAPVEAATPPPPASVPSAAPTPSPAPANDGGAHGKSGDTGPGRGGQPPHHGSPPGAAPVPDLAGERLFGWRPVVRFGVAGSHDLATHDHLPLGSLLPAAAPVLTFIGVSENGRRALFSLTREVTTVSGAGGCVGGRADCQILSLKAGQAASLHTAARTFRLGVVRIDLVELPLSRQGARAGDSRAAVAPRWAAAVAEFRSFSK